MMATPRDLPDFAIGFSLSEAIVDSKSEIESLEVVQVDGGVELRMWLSPASAQCLGARRRRIAGPTGCGLCGIDSIDEALRPIAFVTQGQRFTPNDIMRAMQDICPLQTIHVETRAVHGAAFWKPSRGIIDLREDVGRHNALDKLAGALATKDVAGENGIVLLTSRVSVEMVQKTATIGASAIVSISAPTALAVRMANAAGITLAAIARADGFEIFTNFDRISS
jgi:FdhD protein